MSMMRSARNFVLLVILLQAVSIAHGDDKAAATSLSNVPTLNQIDKQLAAIDGLQLDAAAKVRAQEYYQQARTELEQLEVWNKQRDNFLARKASAPQRLAKMQEVEDTTPLPDPPQNASLTELEKTLAERQAALDRNNELVKQLDDEPQRRPLRRSEILETIPRSMSRFNNLNHSLRPVRVRKRFQHSDRRGWCW